VLIGKKPPDTLDQVIYGPREWISARPEKLGKSSRLFVRRDISREDAS